MPDKTAVDYNGRHHVPLHAVGICGLAGLLIVAATPVAAAEDEAATSSASEETTRDVLIVTARRREESLEDIPISIAAFGKEDLKQYGVFDFSDLASFVPGLYLAGERRIGIRGISTNVANIGFEGGVGFYLDGVFLSRPEVVNFNLTDIERVEVLRGPQGTLYGRNTVAGAINFITRKPEDTFGATSQIVAGNHKTFEATAALTGPLSGDQLLGRISYSRRSSRGNVENVFTGTRFNGEDSHFGRVQLRYVPNDRLLIDLSGDYLFDDKDRVNLVNESNALIETFFGLEGGDGVTDPFQVNRDTDTVADRTLWGASATINYDLGGGLKVVSITGLRHADRDVPNSDEDRLPFFIFNALGAEADQQFTQEIQLQSPSGGSLEYILGVYYLNSDRDGMRQFPIGDFFPISVAGLLTTDATLRSEAYALFGNADFHFTDRLTLNGGVRWTHEKRDLVNFSQTSNSFFFPDLGSFSDKTSDSVWTGETSLIYGLTPETSVYGKFARGFKSGGYNIDVLDSFAVIDFDNEVVNDYEVGLRGLVGAFQVNLTAYQMDYKNLQQSVFDPSINSRVILNAADARTRGVEFDFSGSPVEALHLNGGVAFTDSKFSTFIEPDGTDRSGEPLPEAPRWTASLAAEYSLPLTGALEFVLRGETTYRSALVFDTVAQEYLVPDVTLVNGRVGLRNRNGNWSIFFWSRNVGDKVYTVSNLTDFLGSNLVGYGERRTFGVQLNVDMN